MLSLIVFVIVIVLIANFVEIFLGRRRKSFDNLPDKDKFPYRKKDYLLTVAERKFFEILEKIAIEHDSYLFVKVRLEDLLWLPKNTENKLKWRGYVRSRHIDFVLCDKENIRPFCAIELDDSTHNTIKAQGIDKMKDKILTAAGLPILRLPVKNFYDQNEISARIAAVLKGVS